MRATLRHEAKLTYLVKMDDFYSDREAELVVPLYGNYITHFFRFLQFYCDQEYLIFGIT